jgi:hypothetical protein
LVDVSRPPFPARESDELQRIVRQEAPNLTGLASRVGRDWLEDDEAEALADVTLNYFLAYQLGPDSEPLPDAGILGDGLSALIEQQRRSFWDELPPDSPAASARCSAWSPAASRTARSRKALFVTEKTAGAHVSSILAKLHVRSRVEVATTAQRLGLV